VLAAAKQVAKDMGIEGAETLVFTAGENCALADPGLGHSAAPVVGELAQSTTFRDLSPGQDPPTDDDITGYARLVGAELPSALPERTGVFGSSRKLLMGAWSSQASLKGSVKRNIMQQTTANDPLWALSEYSAGCGPTLDCNPPGNFRFVATGRNVTIYVVDGVRRSRWLPCGTTIAASFCHARGGAGGVR